MGGRNEVGLVNLLYSGLKSEMTPTACKSKYIITLNLKKHCDFIAFMRNKSGLNVSHYIKIYLCVISGHKTR